MQRLMEVLAASAPKRESGDGGEGAGQSAACSWTSTPWPRAPTWLRHGTTKEQFARVAVKNHLHGSLNPHAQYRERYSLEEILASPLVAEPLTRLMCSPIGDGAAAAVIVPADKARQYTGKPVFIKASVVGSGQDHGPDDPGISERLSRQAYEMAGVSHAT